MASGTIMAGCWIIKSCTPPLPFAPPKKEIHPPEQAVHPLTANSIKTLFFGVFLFPIVNIGQSQLQGKRSHQTYEKDLYSESGDLKRQKHGYPCSSLCGEYISALAEYEREEFPVAYIAKHWGSIQATELCGYIVSYIPCTGQSVYRRRAVRDRHEVT